MPASLPNPLARSQLLLGPMPKCFAEERRRLWVLGRAEEAWDTPKTSMVPTPAWQPHQTHPEVGAVVPAPCWSPPRSRTP